MGRGLSDLPAPRVVLLVQYASAKGPANPTAGMFPLGDRVKREKVPNLCLQPTEEGTFNDQREFADR